MDAERARLVDDKPTKSKSSKSSAGVKPAPTIAEPALGDDGFPIPQNTDSEIDDISKGVAAALAAHDAITAVTGVSGVSGVSGASAGMGGGVYADGGEGESEPDLEAQENAHQQKSKEMTDAVMRRAFLRKVYGILSAQMIVTVVVCAFLTLNSHVRSFVVGHALGLQILCIVPLLILLVALMSYKSEYPTNLYLLGAFTLVESLNLGSLCAVVYEGGAGKALLLAVVLTALAFTGLTVFTLQSKYDFSWMGAGLFAGLMVLLFGSLISVLVGWQAQFPIALLGTCVFAGYVIYDTYLIMKRHSYDDYIIAAIDLYLDIINLFIYLLKLILSFVDRR